MKDGRDAILSRSTVYLPHKQGKTWKIITTFASTRKGALWQMTAEHCCTHSQRVQKKVFNPSNSHLRKAEFVVLLTLTAWPTRKLAVIRHLISLQRVELAPYLSDCGIGAILKHLKLFVVFGDLLQNDRNQTERQRKWTWFACREGSKDRPVLSRCILSQCLIVCVRRACVQMIVSECACVSESV